MAWSYNGATIKGNKADPQSGDSVTVVLSDGTETKPYTYSFDGSQSKAQFVAWVKQEVRAHLSGLNAVPASDDVTAEFDPG